MRRRNQVTLALVLVIVVITVLGYCMPQRPSPPLPPLIVSQADAKQYEIPGGVCTLYPDSPTGRLSCALVRQQGRYPVEGKRINSRCTEAIYVVDGELHISAGDVQAVLRSGDVVYIPPGNPYCIEGKATAFVFIEPKWDKTQNTQAQASK